MNEARKILYKEVFQYWAAQGLNCKQIAEKMGWPPQEFGWKMKEVLGVYPSVYIARMKNEQA